MSGRDIQSAIEDVYSPYTETRVEDLLTEYSRTALEDAVAEELATLKAAYKVLTELRLVVDSAMDTSAIDHHLFREEKQAIETLHERLPRQIEDNRQWIQTLQEEHEWLRTQSE